MKSTLTKYDKRNAARQILRSYKSNSAYLAFIRTKLHDIAIHIPETINLGSFNTNKIAPRVNTNIKRYVELSEQYDLLILDLETKNQQILMDIRLLDSKYASILFKRYIENKNFRVIPKELDYSKGTIHNLHLRALEMFHDIYFKNGK